MTIELWYIIVFLGALLLFWILTKVFRTIAKDFAGGFVIFALIATHLVHPVGLVIGLSIVVASIILATACEIKHLIFKEAV